MTTRLIAPAQALAHLAPALIDELSHAECVLALHEVTLWLRPEQVVPPPGRWRSFTFVAGRGSGKTFGIAHDLNRGVESGAVRQPVLVGPTIDEVRDKQVKQIVDLSPPWFRAIEYRKGVVWPNGVFAPARTADVERPASGDNFDYAWLTEIVKWHESTRVRAFNDVTTATRVGRHPRYLVDTTSAGVNELILQLRDDAARDPVRHIMRRGTIFDNPQLTLDYLVSEILKYGWGTRSADEELLGMIFDQTAGACWHRDWITTTRVDVCPMPRQQTLMAWDPAQSDSPDADAQGLCKAALVGGDVYVTDDLSGRMTPGDAADTIVGDCALDCAGVVIETNKMGQMPRQLVEAAARAKHMRVVLLKREESFPPRRPGTVYVKEYHTNETKEVRATPAAQLYRQGRAHHVGTHVELEREQTTWEPGARRSPNRLDSCAYVVSELAGIAAPVTDGRAAVSDATAAHTELQRMLSRRRGRRGLGVG